VNAKCKRSAFYLDKCGEWKAKSCRAHTDTEA